MKEVMEEFSKPGDLVGLVEDYAFQVVDKMPGSKRQEELMESAWVFLSAANRGLLKQSMNI